MEADCPRERGLADLMRLVSPFGVVSQLRSTTPVRGLPALVLSHAALGPATWNSEGRAGYGCAFSAESARTIALAEAAERYAGITYEMHNAAHIAGAGGATPEGWTWGRAAELDGNVLDLAQLPRCSETEYAAPGCPLVPFSSDATIRWARGIDLCSGAPTWVPAVMACYGIADRVPGEHFWHAISTGYAVHTDPRRALLSAICEVIERDIIEVLWSQMLPLPPVPGTELTGTSRELLTWYADHFVNALVFDATSDLGVPTAYCLTVAEHDPVLRQAVSCATGVTLAEATEKVLTDSARFRRGVSPADPARTAPVKSDVADFTALADGMRYMGLPEHAQGFAFLVQGAADRIPRDREPLPADPGDRLDKLVDVLAGAGMQTVAVDRTTPELRDAGLTAFCAVIPGLQPMTTRPLARFLAHPRLYSAPARMGYRVLPEEELNPWPQPFA
ncbi:MAG TPA: YcaO-like family protein [Streptosporangiaceae bacterium]|jgi:ribosomal protein S12 methylthiotransferase accessory factor